MFELTFISPYTFVFFSISFEQTFRLLLLLWIATKILFAMSVEPGNEDVMPEASEGHALNVEHVLLSQIEIAVY